MTYATTLAALEASGNLRSIPEGDTRDSLIDLSSNDYLGIASRPGLQEEFLSSPEARAIPLTSSASRLLSGRQTEFTRLESMLADLYGRPALLFNSGYHANTGLVSALASEKGTCIIADRLVHASIIDGIILSRAPFTRFPHNDTARLEHIITRHEAECERILVIVESIYSMDGDTAPLRELASIRERHPKVMLYVDEAHAFGVCGPHGLGLAATLPDPSVADIVVGTFGKACASTGAFAVMDETLRAYAVNRARSLIFSTSLPPLQAAWTRFVIERMIGMDAERAKLDMLGRRLAEAIGSSPSHIIPHITGDAGEAVRLSHSLLEEGFKVLPIRTPTVPPGTERLRISLSAALDADDIDRFTSTLLSLTSH